MSLSNDDNKQLRAWFHNINDCVENGIDLRQTLIDYYSYREKISKLVLFKLEDLFVIKKSEWFIRNKIREDDTISIIHDSLLVVLDKFKVDSNVKFITFFWRVLHSRLLNFISKHKKVKSYSSRFIPDPLLMGLDFSHIDTGQVSAKTCLNIPLDCVLHFARNTNDCAVDYNFLLEEILSKLSGQQQFILESVLKGDTVNQIAESLSVSGQTVRVRLKKIQEKFIESTD